MIIVYHTGARMSRGFLKKIQYFIKIFISNIGTPIQWHTYVGSYTYSFTSSSIGGVVQLPPTDSFSEDEALVFRTAFSRL